MENCDFSDSYNTFFIPKKSGKREIHATKPESDLHEIQRNMLVNYLDHITLPRCCKGFVKNESYFSCLDPHSKSKYFLRLDIEKFFPSINGKIIDKIFSMYLPVSKDDKDSFLQIFKKIVLVDDKLPQGAITSPYISNIVMIRFDQRLLKYCQSLGIKYTRYADDMFFSSTDFNFEERKWFLKKVKFILKDNGFKLNYKKNKYGRDKISLNGIVVGNGKITLSRNRLKDIRNFTKIIWKNKNEQSDDLIKILNGFHFRYINSSRQPFASVNSIIQFLNGYRAFLISLIYYNQNDIHNTEKICKLINNIQEDSLLLSKTII